MISRYFHTLRYLKPVQWRYRIFYFCRNRWRKLTGFVYPAVAMPPDIVDLQWTPSIRRPSMWQSDTGTFTWLGLAATFPEQVNWRFSDYGKLWTYNLHYFEYLTCEGVDTQKAVSLMMDFVREIPRTPEANEPYPIALRLLFWIRFLNEKNIRQPELDHALYAQALALMDQRELHLLGNHYLENGFGLLFAAYRFRDKRIFRTAKAILTTQLEEQILPDGGHFERSPMYHQILLYRLLDAVNLVKNNRSVFENDILDTLTTKAAIMLGWLTHITFFNGQIPLFNDAAFGIAPETAELEAYAARLGILPQKTTMGISGYRRMEGADYELLADVGAVGPDYIPGHAHSDTLGFELHVYGQPVIVDTGTSTYEKNDRRQLERSTRSHNTVQIDDREQTEVWGGFRVAQRAFPVIEKDTPTELAATHTGYDFLGVRHYRTFTSLPAELIIRDALMPFRTTTMRHKTATCYLHFHPDVVIATWSNDQIVLDGVVINIEGADKVEMVPFEYAPRFNQRQTSQKAVIRFTSSLVTTIKVNKR